MRRLVIMRGGAGLSQGVIAEGRQPLTITGKQVKRLQEKLVGILPIQDLR